MNERFRALLVALALLVGVAIGGLAGPHAGHVAARGDDATYDAPLLTSAARTATGVGTQACGFGKFTKIAVSQSVTAASGTTPTLDTVVQHSIDGGTTWYTLITFTQRTGVANELKLYADVDGTTAQVIGDCLRASYTIAGTTPSFTFKLDIEAQ